MLPCQPETHFDHHENIMQPFPLSDDASRERTRVDKRVFWPQYFRKIEYVCLIGFRLT